VTVKPGGWVILLTQLTVSSCCKILFGKVFKSFGLANGNSMVKGVASSEESLILARANDQRLSMARLIDTSLS
jgi:hypothetical protein